jgi:hypothetical protein
MHETSRAELAKLPETATGAEQYGAMGRAYARFASENAAYFRVMFELPSVPHVECPEPAQGPDAANFDSVVSIVDRGMCDGSIRGTEAQRVAVIGWGLVHGLTSLYLSGHLSDAAPDQESFMTLVEDAMGALGSGWREGADAGRADEPRGSGD